MSHNTFAEYVESISYTDFHTLSDGSTARVSKDFGVIVITIKPKSTLFDTDNVINQIVSSIEDVLAEDHEMEARNERLYDDHISSFYG